MTALKIQDLEVSKDLTRKDLAAVRGGFNAALIGGQTVFGGGILSPTIAVNTPTLSQISVAPVTIVDLNLANIIASANTGVLQA
jgi:hypothetical protein